MRGLRSFIVSLVLLLLCSCSSAYPSSNTTSTLIRDASVPSELSIYSEYISSFDESSEILRIIEQKLNTKFTYVKPNINNPNMLDILLASGNIPDIFFSSNAPRGIKVNKWIKNNIISEYDRYFDFFPNIRQHIKKYSGSDISFDDKFYMLPVEFDKKTSINNCYQAIIRQDHFPNFDLVSSFNNIDFISICKEAANLGQDNYTIITSGIWGLFELYFDYLNNEDFYIDKNGVLNFILFARELYKDKLINSDFNTINKHIALDRFINGDASILITNINGVAEFKSIEIDNPEIEDNKLATIPLQSVNNSNDKEYRGGTYIKYQNDINKDIKAPEFLDYILSEEGRILLNYGIEGKHFRREGKKIYIQLSSSDGRSVTLDESDKASTLRYLISWNYGVDGFYYEDKYMAEFGDLGESLQYVEYMSQLPDTNSARRLISKSLNEDKLMELEKFASDNFLFLITSSENIDKDIDEFLYKLENFS